MVKTLELAISKAAALSEAAQEQLGRELLDRIERLNQLRTELEVGIAQLDAGMGKELDIEHVIKQLHEEHARR
jgi:hypothetical protein